MENTDTPNTTDTMICPQCNAEYYAHVEMCKDCEITLVNPMTGLPNGVKMAETGEYEGSSDNRFDAPASSEPQSSIAGTDPIHGSGDLTPQGGAPHNETDNLENITVKYIDSGPMTRLTELSGVLTSSGIQSSIVPGPQGMCSTDKALVVRAEDAENAMDIVTEYWKRVHPELAQALDDADAGLCPACGADTSSNPNECSDCGLTLVIQEEHDAPQG